MAIQLDGTTGISTTGNIIADGTLSVGTFNPSSINATGNVAGANLNTAGALSVGGNAVVTGDLTVTGNASLSGNIVGDKITNGTTSVEIQTPNGNANITIGGTSNVVVFTTTGVNVTGAISANGNITGGNVNAGGLSLSSNVVSALNSTSNITTTANIAGSYFLGNGSLLTGIDATSIQNGTSNVRVVSSGGNVAISVGGTSNVAVYDTTGEYVTGLISATGNITGGNLSGTSIVGTLTTAAQTNITSVGTLGSLSVTGNTTSGNVLTGGLISATGNITGNYILGNGSQLTGIDATSIQNGTSNVRVVSSGGNVAISVGGTSNVAVYDTTGEYVTGLISATGNVVTTANISGGYILGNGSLLTGIDATSIQNGTSNVRVVSSGGNVAIGVGGTGNVAVYATTGEYVTGLISATGNITAGNLSGTSIVGTLTTAAQTNITSVGTLGSLAVTGNTTSGNVLTGGLISATGNINSGNVIPTNQVILPNGTAALPSLVFDKGGTNLGLYNNMGTLYFAFNSANRSSINNDRMHAVGVTNTAASPVLAVQSTNTGFFTENSNNTLSITATATHVASFNNITASNSTTTGAIVSMGGIGAAGNIYAGGLISATGNITGGNILGGANVNATTHTGTTVSVTANVTGGNVLTGGVVSATGNVTGGNVLGGTVSVSANITGGNILTGGLISATGNITGGNVNTNNIVGTGLTLVSTGDLTLSTTGNINANNEYINNVPQPQQNADAANKQYVDGLVSTAISYHSPVTAATITTLATATGGTITYAQPNGAANGVGATLTTTGSFNLIDTANIQTIGTRVLVKDEGNAVFNGVYTWANATAIVRATDADTYGAGSSTQLGINDYFFVQSGNVNAGAAYIVNAPSGTITFGTSNITFAEFSKSQVYSANTSAGISLNGTVINALVDNVTTAFSSGNIVVKTSAQFTTPNIGDATGTSLSTTGNITGGNLSGTSIVGTLTTAAQTNITSVGTLTSLSVTGNITSSANIIAMAGNLVTDNIKNQGGTGIYLAPGPSGYINFYTSAGDRVSITDTGNISAVGNVIGGNLTTGGLITATGNITGGNLSGTSIVGTLTTAAQTNITSVGTLTSLAVTGNTTSGNFVGTLNGSGANVTSISATNISSGTLAQARLANASLTVNGTSIALGGSGTITATATGTLTIGSGLGGTSYNGSTGVTITNTGVLSLANGGGITASASTGAITLGSTATSANTVGAIVARGASGEFSAGVITATATSARYADLAESYAADAKYAPGTVLTFGGSHEVTLANESNDVRIAGVVSTNPAHVMNASLDAEHVAVVALTGRVPTSVVGSVLKGDMMVSAGNGTAQACATPSMGTVIGKALENFDGESGTIEIVVGRL